MSKIYGCLSHPLADIIIAWMRGEQIQYRSIKPKKDYWVDISSWTNDPEMSTPAFCAAKYEYRIKPRTKVILYRPYFRKDMQEETTEYHISVVQSPLDLSEALDKKVQEDQYYAVENSPNFVKWLDLPRIVVLPEEAQ